jgi:uncharacterized RmlC-like cupin family protein
MAEVLVPPGGGPPPHVHHREDESFYLQEGTLMIQAGEEFIASPGDFVHIPRGIVHCFKNTGPGSARMLVTATPAGLEKFFAEAFDPAPDNSTAPPPASEAMLARLMEAAPRHGLELLIPVASAAKR